MKRKLSILLCMVLLLLAIPVDANAKQITKEEKINKLIDKRAEYVCLEDFDNVNLIDKQLKALGVKELSPQEVKSKFMNQDNGFTTYVVKPEQDNVTWLSTTTDYTYSGKTYTVQTLIAQANSEDSALKNSGSRAIASSYKWKVGSMNALSTVASTLVGEIPGSSLLLTVYDTASSFVTGISKTTEISSAEIVYSWSHVTTASFKYVKIKGMSDDYQDLTFISTKGVTAIGYQYPTFSYAGGSVTPNVIQGKRTVYSTPAGYNSTYNAVVAYTDPYAASLAYVNSVQITGLESKTVSNIYPVTPAFPAHLF